MKSFFCLLPFITWTNALTLSSNQTASHQTDPLVAPINLISVLKGNFKMKSWTEIKTLQSCKLWNISFCLALPFTSSLSLTFMCQLAHTHTHIHPSAHTHAPSSFSASRSSSGHGLIWPILCCRNLKFPNKGLFRFYFLGNFQTKPLFPLLSLKSFLFSFESATIINFLIKNWISRWAEKCIRVS